MQRLVYGIGSGVGVIVILLILWCLHNRYGEKCTFLIYIKTKLWWKRFFVWGGLSLLAVAVLYGSSHWGNNMICCLRNLAVYVWLIPIACIDYQEKIIPNKLLAIGAGLWLVLVLLDLFVSRSDWLTVFKFSGMGMLLGAGIFLVGKLFVKDGIGMGDVKLYGILGLLYGYLALYSMLLITLVVLFIVGLYMLIRKKGNRKMTLPMAPYTLLGFLCAVALGM